MTTADLYTISLQVALPLALIGWLALAPLRSRAGFLVQALATGLAPVALLLAAIWIIPPWWMPHVYIGLWLVAVAWRSAERLPNREWLPDSARSWVGLAVMCALSVGSAAVIGSALTGRAPAPGVRVENLAFPLGPGRYLVANGGASETINAHLFTLDPQTDRQRAYRGQSYAVDIIGIDSWGLRSGAWRPADPADFVIFGKPVLAPCRGRVLATRNDRPDMPVPVPDTSLIEGNHVVIGCDGFAVLLAHLQRGSVAVKAGDDVESGELLGRVGNSGQSAEPHLHAHAQAIPGNGPLLSGEPYFLTFDGEFPVRNARIRIR